MKIDSYRFGKMVVNGKSYTNDLKIFPDRVKSNWWRKSGHNLSRSDIKDIIDFKPEVFIIETGKMGAIKVSDNVKKNILENGIQNLYIEKSSKAVELYNQEPKEKKVAAFHLTC